MHFSMAMEPPAFWLVRPLHVSREIGRRKRRIGTSAIAAGQHGRSGGAATALTTGRKRAGRVPKILVNRLPVTIWQEIKGYQMVNFYRRFERERANA
jgi:hypothetical protein